MSLPVLRFFQRSDFAAVLARRNFRYLLAAYIASGVGNGALFYGLLLHLLREEARIAPADLLIAASIYPILVVRPLAGLLADRVDRKLLMLYAQVARVFVLAVLMIVGHLGLLNGILLAVGAFLLVTAGEFFSVARSAMLPSLVARHELVAGNAALSVHLINRPISMAGGTVAGFLITAFGGLNALGAAIFLYGLAAFLISAIDAPGHAGVCRGVVSDVRPHVRLVAMALTALRDLANSLTFVVKAPLLRAAAVAWVILDALVISALPVVVARFIDDTLRGISVSIWVGQSAIAVGTVICLLAIPWVSRRIGDGKTGLLALLALGALFAVMAALGGLWQGVAILVALSVRGAATLPLWSIVQAECPDHLRGRVLANIGTVGLILAVLGSFAFTAFIDLTSLRTGLMAAGVVAITLSLALLRVDEVRQARLAANPPAHREA